MGASERFKNQAKGDQSMKGLRSDPLVATVAHAVERLLPESPAPIFEGAATGRIAGFDHGLPLVVPARGDRAIVARAIVDLHGDHIGREVLLVFDRGDASRPIVVGLIREPDLSDESAAPAAGNPGAYEVLADGERMVISARNQLVLRCGDASITLTAAGKVLIHGKYVSSRAEGVNRVNGGSVHLN